MKRTKRTNYTIYRFTEYFTNDYYYLFAYFSKTKKRKKKENKLLFGKSLIKFPDNLLVQFVRVCVCMFVCFIRIRNQNKCSKYFNYLFNFRFLFIFQFSNSNFKDYPDGCGKVKLGDWWSLSFRIRKRSTMNEIFVVEQNINIGNKYSPE